MKYLGIIALFLVLFLTRINSLEKYVFLPISSDYCQEHPIQKKFTLTQHIKLESGAYNKSVRDVGHVCNVMVVPNGRMFESKMNNRVRATLWHLRFRINIEGCDSTVEVTYAPDINQKKGVGQRSENVTCYNRMPYVVNAEEREISFKMHSKNGKYSKVDIDIASYIWYQDSDLETKYSLCKMHGFWCSNETKICLHTHTKCDQGDSCFDGGSDEKDCIVSSVAKSESDHWSPYVPWTATLLVLIPVLVILVLRLFSFHKHSFGDFDSLSQNEFEPAYLDKNGSPGNRDPGDHNDDKSSNHNYDNSDSDYSTDKKRDVYLTSNFRNFREPEEYFPDEDDGEKSPLDKAKVPILINSNLNIIKEDRISNPSQKDAKHVHYERYNGSHSEFNVERISDGSTISKGESGFFTDSSSSGIGSALESQKQLRKFKNSTLNSDLIDV